MNLLGIYGTISDYVLVFVPISWFVIVLSLIWGVFFVNFDDNIFNESFLKAHALFFDVFVCLQEIHNHVVCKTRMCIVSEHLDKLTFGYGA